MCLRYCATGHLPKKHTKVFINLISDCFLKKITKDGLYINLPQLNTATDMF